MRIVLFKVILLLLPAFAVASVDTLSVQQERQYSLRGHAWYILTDPNTSAQQVAQQWQQNPDSFQRLDRFSRGYHEEIFWIVIPIRWRQQKDASWLLELANPHVDSLQFFQLHDGVPETLGSTTGDDTPFRTRSYVHRHFVWPLQAAENSVYLIRVDKRNSSVGLPLYLWEEETFRAANTRMLLFFGICFGMMALVAIYAFFAGVLLPDKLYLLYSLFVVLAILFLATFEGLSFQFLYPNWPNVNSLFRVIIAGTSTAALILFSMHFLSIPFHLPRVARIQYIIVVFFLLLILSTLFFGRAYRSQGAWMVPLVLGLSTFGNLLSVYAALVTVGKQRLRSLFYLSAYALVVGTGIIMMLEDFGIIERLTFNPMFIGALAEIIAFSVALTILMARVYQERNRLALDISRHQRELIRSQVEGTESERRRISRELHDDIGSRISHLVRLTEAGSVEEAVPKLRTLAADIRDLSHRLAPPVLATGFEQMVEELAREAAKSAGLQASVQCYNVPLLPESLQTEVYRILQEAVHNVVRHAAATQLDIQVFGHEDELVVTVEDNGQGFEYRGTTAGIGLRNMEQRAATVGGRLDISSTKGRGTTLMLVVHPSITVNHT